MIEARLLGLRFWRSQSARALLFYLAVFLLSCSLVLGVFYQQTMGRLLRETDRLIESEAAVLGALYAADGLETLIRDIEYRGGQPRGHIYWLARDDGVKLAGNLDRLPNLRASESLAGDWVSFTLGREGERIRVRGLWREIEASLILFVGRDMAAYLDVRRNVRNGVIYALVAMLALGLGGGLVLVRGLLARLERINRTSAAIIGGDMRRRIWRSSRGDEFDILADNLNAMLDRIDTLIAAHREVADNIAHDLRSPISRLRSQLELILLTAPAKQKTALESAIADADDILKTFNALLELAQLEAGSIATPAQNIDLTALVQEIGDLFTPAIEAAGMTLELDVSAIPLMCCGHKTLLAQALSNLIENALKYGHRKGGTLTLSLKIEGDMACLALSDMGAGIAPSHRAHAMMRFVRLDAARDNSAGRGLGLSLVAAIAHAHGGTLTLNSATGGGLKAQITLNLKDG